MARRGIAAKAFGLEEGRKRRPGVAQGMQAKAFNKIPPPPPGVAVAKPVTPPHGQMGLSQQNAQPELGAQLTGRVQSGAIDQEQAQHTAHERRVFEEAFGPEWRTHVYGGAGIVQANRSAIAGGNNGPQALAFQKKLMEDRQQALEAAEAKLGR